MGKQVFAAHEHAGFARWVPASASVSCPRAIAMPRENPSMDAIADVSAALQPSTSASSREIASRLSAVAIDADEGMVKQMLATLLSCQLRPSDEALASQLGVLMHLFLTLRSMALSDDLTGLYNRRGFLRAGTRLLSAASRDRRGALLFYIDVDDLKSVNDSEIGRASCRERV